MLRRLKRWLRKRNQITCAQAGRKGGNARYQNEREFYAATAAKLARHIKRPDLADKLEGIRDE